MDRLTREEIEWMRAEMWALRPAAFTMRAHELCDLALQSLSQEAVREEVLENDVVLLLEAADYAQFSNLVSPVRDALFRVLDALKREPNAAESFQSHPKCPHPSRCFESSACLQPVICDAAEPAPAAPDVVRMRDRTVSAWLIEFGEESPVVHTYFSAGGGTTNAYTACWFSRKVDAEAIAFTYLQPEQKYRIVSHGFELPPGASDE